MDAKVNRIVNLCSIGIAVVFELVLGITTIIKLQKLKSVGNKILKYLFTVSFMLALLATIIMGAINVILADKNPQITSFVICDVIFWFCFLSFFITLLGNLVARLHFAFNDSKFKMSRNNKCLFGITFILLFLFCIASAISILLQHYHHIFGDYSIMDTHAIEHRLIMISIPFTLMFLVGSALSICFFVNNVSELVKMQSVSSSHSCDLNTNAQDIPLNARQQTILHLSAKYISLFYVASLSTILSLILSLTHLDLAELFISIDICFNLLCLHLQFAFAKKQYQKCCCCWDSCCTAMVQSKAKKSIFEESKINALPVRLSSDPLDSDEDEDVGNDGAATNTDPLIEKTD